MQLLNSELLHNGRTHGQSQIIYAIHYVLDKFFLIMETVVAF